MENEELLESDTEQEEVGVGEEVKKSKLTPEQILGIKKRQFTKLAKELGVSLEQPETKSEPKVEATKAEPKDFDYGKELAKIKLIAKGIPEEDHDWLIQGAERVGEDVLLFAKDEIVQTKLKERSAARTADVGVPTGGNRSQGTYQTEDTVEYWVALDKQPPETKSLDFRKKVLKARTEKAANENRFADNSIVAPGFPIS